MKARMSLISRDESGKILVLALVLLVLGALLLTPLLGLMNTGLIAGQTYEKKMAELYAADAGVEDAIWRIRHLEGIFDDDYYSYPDSDSEPPWMINEKSISVEIWRTEVEGLTLCHRVYEYHIRSTAETIDGSITTIDAVVTSTDLDFSDLAGNAITSGGDVTIQSQGHGQGAASSEIHGDIVLDGDLNPDHFEPISGEVKLETLIWPTEDEIADFYWRDVKHATHYYSDTVIDLDGADSQVGPLYVEGKLDVYNQRNVEATLTLAGTIYVTDDTRIGTTRQDFILDLNGNTIFVESASRGSGNEAIRIGDRVTIKGPGAIIAIGDIYFGPKAQLGGDDHPVLIYSVAGAVTVQPGGNLYGAIVGSAEVTLQPNNEIVYPQGGFHGINFPGLFEGKETYRIDSWTISTAVPD